MLDCAPELSGEIAMHHGSISQELRGWVEDQLHEGKLKAVVCTSSLDLGVDFRPVESVVQVGSPKGIARFLQRAGRSGHRPGAVSRLYFVPTHSLELIEAAAIR
jgi:ATP-dependent Lhr-like helicase